MEVRWRYDMLNLNSFTYSDVWFFDKNDFILKNRFTKESYSLWDAIFYSLGTSQFNLKGVLELDSCSFLIHVTIAGEFLHYVMKFSFKGENFTKIFSESCKHFYILSDITILFDNRFVLNVMTNDYIKEFEWLSLKEITLIAKPSALKVKFPVAGTEYLLAYVDTLHFKVLHNKVFSSLRGKTFKLSRNHEIADVISQEVKYWESINAFYSSQEEKDLNAFQKEILG